MIHLPYFNFLILGIFTIGLAKKHAKLQFAGKMLITELKTV